MLLYKICPQKLEKCKKIRFLVIVETFTPVSLFWTNNNLLLSQTKSISSKHTCSPTTPVNIRITSLSVLYLWHHKLGKNRIFLVKTKYCSTLTSILGVKDCENRKKRKVHFLWGYNQAFISRSPFFHISQE